MSWAKSVLPMFTGDSSETLRIAPDQVQIDTAHFRPQAPAKSALSRTRLAVNRTAVNRNMNQAASLDASAVQHIFKSAILFRRQFQPDVQLLELLGRDFRRRTHQQILGALVHR